MLNNSNSQSGSSTLLVLGAAALTGFIALTLIQSVNDLTATGQQIRIQTEVSASYFDILALMRDRTLCEKNFVGRTAGAGPYAIPQIKGANANIHMSVGDIVGLNTVRVQSIVLRNFVAYSVVAPDDKRGTMELTIDYRPVSGNGMARIRTVLLYVETNGYPPVVAGPANNIKTCVAIGSDRNDVWRVSSNGDINYGGGKVGIGTLTPGAALEVAGNVGATDYRHPSDLRLKKDLHTVDGLHLIHQLKGVTFDWRDGQGSSYGLVAQDVEKTLPSAVRTSLSNNLKAVDYDQMIAPLIEAIKELALRNQKLRTRVKELETKS